MHSWAEVNLFWVLGGNSTGAITQQYFGKSFFGEGLEMSSSKNRPCGRFLLSKNYLLLAFLFAAFLGAFFAIMTPPLLKFEDGFGRNAASPPSINYFILYIVLISLYTSRLIS